MSQAARQEPESFQTIESEFKHASEVNAEAMQALIDMSVGESVELTLIPRSAGQLPKVDAANSELSSGISQLINRSRRDADKVQTNAHTELREDGTVVSISHGIWFPSAELTHPVPVSFKVVKRPPTRGAIPRISSMEVTVQEPQQPRVVFATRSEPTSKRQA
jgi:hypothetical protein